MISSLFLPLGRLWSRRTGKKARPVACGTEPAEADADFRVRPAVKSDYAQICELYEELDAFHRAARPDIFDRASAPPRDRSTILAQIRGWATTILVAEDMRSLRLQGFVYLVICDLPASTVCRARRFVEIDKLVVRSEARRTGIGRALLEAAFAWADERGFSTLEVAVHEFNSGAIALYEAMGFTTVLRRMMRKG